MKVISLLFTVILFVSCKYEQRTKCSDIIQQNLRGSVQQLEDTTFDIDSSGNDKISSVRIIDFDSNGYATRYVYKDATGKIVVNETAKHYSNGAIKEFLNMVDGKQISKMTIDIDKEGNYAAARTYDSSYKQDRYYTDIKENNYGIIYAAKLHFMNGRLESGFDLKYDKANIIGGTYTDSFGKVSYVFTSRLNDKGDAIDKVSTTFINNTAKKEIITYTYDSYDNKGNWKRQITYNDKGKPIQTIKRSLVYYKG